MRAAADQIDIAQIFESIVRSHVQHLAEIVSEIECRAAIEPELIEPSLRSDHAFGHDTLPHIA